MVISSVPFRFGYLDSAQHRSWIFDSMEGSHPAFESKPRAVPLGLFITS
jgi:hypothetical protein